MPDASSTPLRLLWAVAPAPEKAKDTLRDLAGFLNRDQYDQVWVASHRGNRDMVQQALQEYHEARLVHLAASWYFDERTDTSFRQTRETLCSLIQVLDRQVARLPPQILHIDLVQMGALPLRMGMIEAVFLLARATTWTGELVWPGLSFGLLANPQGSLADPAQVRRCSAAELLAVRALIDGASEAGVAPPRHLQARARLEGLKVYGWRGTGLPVGCRDHKEIDPEVLGRAVFWQADHPHPCGLDPDLLAEKQGKANELGGSACEHPVDSRSVVRILHCVVPSSVHHAKAKDPLAETLDLLRRDGVDMTRLEVVLVVIDGADCAPILTGHPGPHRILSLQVDPSYALYPDLAPSTMRQVVDLVRPLLDGRPTLSTVAGPGWWRLLLDRWQRSGLIEQRRILGGPPCKGGPQESRLTRPVLLEASDLVRLAREAPMLPRRVSGGEDPLLPGQGWLTSVAHCVRYEHRRETPRPCRITLTGANEAIRCQHAAHLQRLLEPIPSTLQELTGSDPGVVVCIDPVGQTEAPDQLIEVGLRLPDFDTWAPHQRQAAINRILDHQEVNPSLRPMIAQICLMKQFSGSWEMIERTVQRLARMRPRELMQEQQRLAEDPTQQLGEAASERDYWKWLLGRIIHGRDVFIATALGEPTPVEKLTTKKQARFLVILALMMERQAVTPEEVGTALQNLDRRDLGDLKTIESPKRWDEITRTKFKPHWEGCERTLFGETAGGHLSERQPRWHELLVEALRVRDMT